MNNLAIKITKAMVASDYGLSAIGIRGVYFDEALQIIQIILSSKETDRTSTILKRLKLLHKHNPNTIEINKSATMRCCENFNEESCNCFYPDVEEADYFCQIQRSEYLKETDYRNTPEYKEWRTAVFERDKYTCQKCGLKHCVLNAHHKKTYKKHPELRFDVPNGETLCFDCHQQKHRRRI